MKRKIILNTYYMVSFAYVFLGVCLLDWSFNMVPPAGNVPPSEIIETLVVDSAYILMGIMLFGAVFLSSRKKVAGDILFKIVFLVGLFLIIGSTVAIVLMIKFRNISSMYLADIPMHIIFFTPVILLFINRKKILEAK
ncbi:MAG: hypothetical protein P9L90_07010 [Candidatus Aadella gelida]|nr:hypothetical protein [Candidatus Aadella gelida]